MNQVTWEHFDGTRFQKFCNELLLFEVSKFAMVYSAPGADNGIDQLYYGIYNSKEGKWRFQDKFHNSGNKNNDISALKTDIKNDIIANYHNEDFLVFITNVNLSPKQHKTILEIAEGEITKLNVECNVIIWHKANIEALLSSHPILYHWNWVSSATIILQSHLEYFKAQLSNSSSKRNNFCNHFFGRNKELETLNEFLEDDTKHSLALVANGGYGKTRLCIEFMNQVMKSNNEWIPLIVANQGYNSNDFKRLLLEPKRLFILLDNANEVPEILDDIKRQIEAANGRAKLLITTRNTLFNQTLKRLSSHNRDIDKIELSRLTPDETLKMLKTELPFVSDRNLIALRDISKGIPNVLVELIRTINSGKNPNSISNDDFFTRAVLDIVDQIALDIQQNLGITFRATVEFLQILSILSPIDNDEKQLDFVSKIVNLPIYDIQNLINELENIGLIEKRGKISIRPDPYSDVILMNTFKKVPNLITRLCNQEGAFYHIENIIKNLAEAELPNSEKNIFTQRMLYDYFDVISNDTAGGDKIKSAIQLANDISIVKPEIAVVVINKWIDLLNNESHPIHSQREFYANKTYVETINGLIKGIFYKLYNHTNYKQDDIPGLHTLVEEFIKASNDLKVLHSCYTYEHHQFRCLGYDVQQCCKLQYYLKASTSRYLSSSDEFLISIGLEACSVLLQLDFQLDYYYDNVNGTFTYGHYYLPECNHTKQIRLEILSAIIEFYNSKRGNKKQREEAFTKMTEHIFHCSPASFERYRFDTSAEVPFVLNFCRTILLEKPTMWERTKVLAVISRYNKGRIKEEFIESLNELILLSSELNSSKEKLEFLLKNEDYFDSRINTGNKFLNLIEEYKNDDNLQDDFLLLSNERSYLGTPFFDVLQTLIENKSNFAKQLLEKVLNHYKDRIGEFCSLIKAFYQDEIYFASVIQRLNANDASQLGTIVWMLIYGRNRDSNFYRISDLKYFQIAIESNNEHALRFLTSEFIQFAFLNKEKVFALYDSIIAKSKSTERGGLFYSIFSDEKIIADFTADLKCFIDRNLELLPLTESFGGHEVLSFVENKYGFDALYRTVKDWLDEKAKENNGYLSTYDYFLNNPKKDASGEVVRFCSVVKKYVTLPESKLDSSVEHQLLKMFRPKAGYSDLLSESILAMTQELNNDKLKLTALAKAVSIFPSTTELTIVSMCQIATSWLRGMESFTTLKQVYNFFGQSFYLGQTSRSKSGRGPYPQDVARKNLFENIIGAYEFPDIIKQYLQKCLDRVNKEIENEIENDYLMSGRW